MLFLEDFERPKHTSWRLEIGPRKALAGGLDAPQLNDEDDAHIKYTILSMRPTGFLMNANLWSGLLS